MITTRSTIREYLAAWNELTGSGLTEEGRNLRSHLITLLDPLVGGVPLADFTAKHVLAVQRGLEAGSPAKQRGAVALLRSALRFAETESLAPAGCASLLPTYPHVSEPVRVYTPEELRKIFHALRYHPLYNYYRLIYYTLIESREARALQTSDIDLARHTLSITHTIRGKAQHAMRLLPAIPARRRKLLLGPQAEQVVREELRLRDGKRRGMRWREDAGDFLFVHGNGSPYVNDTLRSGKMLVAEMTGIRGFSTASLRFTALAAMRDHGVGVQVMKEVLGASGPGEVFRMQARMYRP